MGREAAEAAFTLKGGELGGRVQRWKSTVFGRLGPRNDERGRGLVPEHHGLRGRKRDPHAS
jgi:hypothetical protein